MPLTDRQKEAVWYIVHEGMTYREAASVMNVDVARVYRLLKRAKKIMRESLEDEPAGFLLAA